MKIEVGDTIRLKSTLRLGETYHGITFFEDMNIRPNRLTVAEVGSWYILASNGFYYSLEMLDIRTLRKGAEQ